MITFSIIINTHNQDRFIHDAINSCLKQKYSNLEILVHNLAKPAKMNTSSIYMNAAQKAYNSTFNKTPILVGEGGTIPVVADFKEILGIDTVMMGFNCPDDCIHSPNERLLLNSFYTSIKTMAHFFNNVRN